MNKEKLFKSFSKKLDSLIETNEIFKYYFQAPYSTSFNFFNKRNTGISIHCGISRVGFVFDDEDYILKIPISLDGDECCKKEVKVYEKAKKEHLDNFFAEPAYIGDYKKDIYYFPIEKVDEYFDVVDNEKNFDSSSFKEKMVPQLVSIWFPMYAYKKATRARIIEASSDIRVSYLQDSFSPLLVENYVGVANTFYETYGEEKYNELSRFLSKMKIDDVHSGNIGMIDKSLVLIDYAGLPL